MRLTTKGLKERDVVLEIGPRTILLGPNGTGKSTALDALRLIALGFVPGLGKTLEAQGPLLRGREAVLDLVLDDQRTVHRAITNTGKGYTEHVECSWVEGSNQAEHALAALHLFGEEEVDVIEVLNIRDLLSLTANKRAARLEKILAAAAASPKKKARQISRYVVQRLTNTDDARMPSETDIVGLQGLEQSIGAALRAVIDEVWPRVRAKLNESGLPATLTWINEQKKVAKQGVADKTQAKRALQGRVDQLAPYNETQLTAQEAERDRLVRAQGATAERRREAAERAGAIADADAAVSVAETAVETARKAAWAVADKAVTADQYPTIIRNRLAVVEGELDELGTPTAPDLSEVQRLEQQADALIEEAEGIDLPEIPSTTAAHDAVEALETEADQCGASPWTKVREVVAKLEVVAKGPGKVPTLLREQIAVLTGLAETHGGATPATIVERLEAARAALSEAAQEERTALERRQAATEKRGRLKVEAATLRDKARLRREALSTPYATQEQRAAALRLARTSLQRDLTAIEDELGQATKLIQTREAALGAARARRDGVGEPIVVEGDDDAALVRVKAEITALRANAAARDELTALIAELEKATHRRDVLTAMEWAAQRVRNEELEDAGGPLRARISQFLAGAGVAAIPYVRAGAGVCPIGWTIGQSERSVEAISGGEWVVFATAFVAAVLALRDVPIRLLLIEAAELDGPHFSELLHGIEAVSDVITHTVIATCHPEAVPDYVHEPDSEWDVVRTPVPTPIFRAA